MDDFGAPMPAHTNSDDPLAQGNAAADRLAARGCAAPHLMTQSDLRLQPYGSRPQQFLLLPGLDRGVDLRCLKCAAGRSAFASLGGILACLLSTLASLSPGLPFFVALLEFFVLSLFLFSLCMIIMGTWWVTNYLSGCSDRFPSTRSRDLPLGT